MPSSIIKASPDNECCSCRATNVRLHKIPKDQFLDREHQHCDFCYSTLAGSRCEYNSPESARHQELMGHVCLVANLLLAKIKKGKP